MKLVYIGGTWGGDHGGGAIKAMKKNERNYKVSSSFLCVTNNELSATLVPT